MLPNTQLCMIMGKVFAYLENNPESGLERLESFLSEDNRLLDTVDVGEITGWTIPYINKLCRSGHLPYIPGKPHKFVRTSLMLGLKKLQVGGDYGRKPSRTLKNRKV